jgi:hypothetical protein
MLITNYQQMKTIFDQPYMRAEDLFSPRNLMATINCLANNKADGTNYVDMTGPERRTWLRTWVHKHHYWLCCFAVVSDGGRDLLRSCRFWELV